MLSECLTPQEQYQTVFQNGHAIGHSYQQHVRVPIIPHPFQHFVYLIFLILGLLVGVVYFVFLRGLLAIFISLKCLFRSFAFYWAILLIQNSESLYSENKDVFGYVLWILSPSLCFGFSFLNNIVFVGTVVFNFGKNPLHPFFCLFSLKVRAFYIFDYSKVTKIFCFDLDVSEVQLL